MKVTFKKLEKAINASLDKETCWPGAWDSKNPTSGHCRVVAAVVHAILGGDILKAVISKKPLYTHFWNKIDGKEYDFTRAQFPKNFIMPKGKKVSFKEVMNAPQIKKTYPILFERVKTYLKINE